MNGNTSAKKLLRRAIISVILICIAVILEFFISNCRILFIDTEEYILDVDGLSEEEKDSVILLEDLTSTVSLSHAPKDVYAVRLGIISPSGDPLLEPIKLVIKGVDAKRGNTLSTIVTTYVASGVDEPHEKTILLDFHGIEAHRLQLVFSGLSADAELVNVTVNPSDGLMGFNLARCLIMLALGVLIWITASLGFMTEHFDFKKTSHSAAVITCVSACMVAIILFLGVFGTVATPIPYPLEKGVHSYNPYVQQTDAFLKGQLHIDYPVSSELLELENPYDYDARKGIYYLWDRAMYDGKYYSYFGIAPIINLYLPSVALTGNMPSDSVVTTFYALSAALFLSLFIIFYVVKYKKKVPVALLCTGIVAAIFSSNIFLMARGYQHFYYIAMIAGMAYLAEFLFFILLALTSEHKILRRVFFALAGLAYAALLLSRLNMALLTAFIVIPILVFGILLKKPSVDVPDGDTPARLLDGIGAKLIDLASLGAFVAAAAVFLLWYNNARFGSPFEFGTKYQLTISDVSQNKLRLSGITGTVYHYFLQPLAVSGNFPTFTLQYSNLYNYGTYVYVDTGMGLFSIPLMLSLVLAIPTFFNKKKTPFAKWLLGALLIGCFFVSFMNFCLGGVIFRYTSDMTLLAALASVLLLFSFNEQTSSSGSSALICTASEMALMIISVLVCASLAVSVNGNLIDYDARVFVWLSELFGK